MILCGPSMHNQLFDLSLLWISPTPLNPLPLSSLEMIICICFVRLWCYVLTCVVIARFLAYAGTPNIFRFVFGRALCFGIRTVIFCGPSMHKQLFDLSLLWISPTPLNPLPQSSLEVVICICFVCLWRYVLKCVVIAQFLCIYGLTCVGYCFPSCRVAYSVSELSCCSWRGVRI